MSTKHLPYITLDSCVLDYLNESEQNNNKYFKVYHIGYRGLENMGLDFFFQVIDLKLPVNSNKTVTIPNGIINVILAGRLNDRGEIIPLYVNNKLTTFAGLSPNRLTQTQDSSTIGANWNYGSNWGNWNGWNYTNIYGTPSGAPFAGNYKVDLNNSVILLDENYREDYIIVKAMISPKDGEDAYLPVQFREALIAWLWWKDGKARPMTSHMRLGAARDAKHEFYNERRNAIAQWKSSTIFEKYQIHQESSREAIKT